MIQEFILEICDILGLTIPQISYDTSHFQSDTMMAQCSPQNNTIYLKKKTKPDPDYMFAIAHELRHLWQYKANEPRYLTEYRSRETFEEAEEYNLQIAEVDANAFAGLVMIDIFGISPMYNGLSDPVKKRIAERMLEIAEEF